MWLKERGAKGNGKGGNREGGGGGMGNEEEREMRGIRWNGEESGTKGERNVLKERGNGNK